MKPPSCDARNSQFLSPLQLQQAPWYPVRNRIYNNNHKGRSGIYPVYVLQVQTTMAYFIHSGICEIKNGKPCPLTFVYLKNATQNSQLSSMRNPVSTCELYKKSDRDECLTDTCCLRFTVCFKLCMLKNQDKRWKV